MRVFHFYRLVQMVIAVGAAAAASGDTIFSDTTFNTSNYSQAFFYNLTPPGDSTVTFAQCTSCGAPLGNALLLTITEPTGGGAFGSTDIEYGILNSTFNYNPSTQGAISSISASIDKDFTVNVAITFNNTFRPLIRQDGNFYTTAISGPVLVGPGTTGYNVISAIGLTAANFVQIDPATGALGTANPNFSGDAMQFGYMQLLGTTGVNGTVATVDLSSVNIGLTTAAPEPASLWTFFAGLMALAIGARLRTRTGRPLRPINTTGQFVPRIWARVPPWMRQEPGVESSASAIRLILTGAREKSDPGHTRLSSIQSMKHRLGIGVLVIGALWAPEARAATTTVPFTITGGGINASGTITLQPTATPDVDEIVAITGTFSSASGGFSGAITGLVPGSYDSNNPTVGLFRYDNLFYPAGAAPGVNGNTPGGTLDDYGVEFTVAGGYTINLFEKGPAVGFLLDDGTSTVVDYRVPVTFAVTAPTPPTPSPTPAPPTIILAALGLAAITLLRLPRLRNARPGLR